MHYIDQQEFTCKILILGESKVGKSSILLRYTDNVFKETIGPTLGIDYKIKRFNIDNKSINMQLWDTAGQERFKSIVESYYNGVHGIALVFDMTDITSFQRIENWMNDIHTKVREHEQKKLVVVMIGIILIDKPISQI